MVRILDLLADPSDIGEGVAQNNIGLFADPTDIGIEPPPQSRAPQSPQTSTPAAPRQYDEIDAYQDVTDYMELMGGPPTEGEVERQGALARYRDGQLRAYQQLYRESPPGNVVLRAVDTMWFDLGATLKAFYYDAIKGDSDAANRVMLSADARRQALAEFDKESVLGETLARGVVNTPASLATGAYGAVAGMTVGNPVGGAVAASAYRAGAGARAEVLADGGTEREANITGAIVAGIEAGVTLGFGAAGRGGLESLLGSGIKWRGLRTAVSQVGAEFSEEQIIEQLSMSVDGVVRGKWPTAEERLQAAIDTAVQTLLGMGAMTGASKVIDFIENPSRKNAREIGLGDVEKAADRRAMADGIQQRAAQMATQLTEQQAEAQDVEVQAGVRGEPDQEVRGGFGVEGDAEGDTYRHVSAVDFDAFDEGRDSGGNYAGPGAYLLPPGQEHVATVYSNRLKRRTFRIIDKDSRAAVEAAIADGDTAKIDEWIALTDRKQTEDQKRAKKWKEVGDFLRMLRNYGPDGAVLEFQFTPQKTLDLGDFDNKGLEIAAVDKTAIEQSAKQLNPDYKSIEGERHSSWDFYRHLQRQLGYNGAQEAVRGAGFDSITFIHHASKETGVDKYPVMVALDFDAPKRVKRSAAPQGDATQTEQSAITQEAPSTAASQVQPAQPNIISKGGKYPDDMWARAQSVRESLAEFAKKRGVQRFWEGSAQEMGYGPKDVPIFGLQYPTEGPQLAVVKNAGISELDWRIWRLSEFRPPRPTEGMLRSNVDKYIAEAEALLASLQGNPPQTPTDAVTQAAAVAVPYNAQDAPGAAGIVPGAQIPAQPRGDAIGASWRSDSPAVEAAIEGARFRPTVQSRWEQLKESAKELAGAFRSRRRFLDEKGNPADATTAEYLRLGEAARSASKTAAVEAMAGYMKPLGGPEQYGLFSRVLLLRDLKRDIDSGKYGDTGLLPFSYDDVSQVAADLAKAEAAAQATPAVAEALAARQAFIHSIRDMAVARKLLPEDVRDFDDYYHHQVIAYLKGSELVDGAAGATSLEDRRAGWQRGRKKLDPKKPISNDRLDYNTEFLDAEYAVVSSMLYKLRMAEVRDAIQGINDIKPRLQQEIEAEREERESRKGRLERQLKQLDPQNDAEAIAGLRKELDAIETESDMKRTWRDLVPEGYVVWQPDKGSVFFRGLTVAEDKLAELVESILASVDASFIKGHVTGERAFPSGLKQMLDTIDIPDIPGIRTALMVGGKKPEWVIPEHVAKELDAYGKSVDPGPVSQFSARVMQMWKRWQLNAPHRFLKYNLNNASGDTDILLAAAPKVLTFLPQAYREVKKLKPGKALTGDLAKAIEHGVIGSGFTSEIDTQGLSQSEVFDLLQGRLTNDVSARVRRILNRTRPEHISEWRENVYRFAAYKHFLSEVKAGRRPWGVTPFQIVEALYARGESPELIAARLSRDLLGDYGNRTVAGEYIRRHLIPFYSFQEINFQRYWNLFKNAVELGSREDLATTQGNQRPGDIASAAGKAIGKRAAYRTLQAGTMAMMYEAFITMYNKLVWPEEDRELAQNGRDQLHLILGRDREGNIITLRMQGAFSDVLGTFGLNVSDVLAVYEGDRPLADVPKETLKAASGKLVNSSLPIAKTIGESLIGYTLFPDPYEPRPLRDPREHLAGMAMPSWFYRKFVSDVPQRVNSTADLVHTLITYSTDPAEASYFASRHLVSEFLKQDGREDVRWAPNAKSNAIYYHKQAIKYGDDELAEKWLQEYKRLGGTAEGYKQSIKSSHPLSGLNAAEKKAFASSLTPEEKEVVKRSIDWYNRIYNKPPTPAR